MPFRRRSDPLARRVALAVAFGRLSIGVATIAATRPALRTLGFPDEDRSTFTLGQLAGGRDIALGTLTILARRDRHSLRAAALVSAGVDSIDAYSLGSAAMRADERSGQLMAGALSGAAAAVIGAWAAKRI